MAGSLADKLIENQIVQKIAHLEQQVIEMRSNQIQKAAFGNILLDGTGSQGTITLGNGMVLTVDGSGNGIITITGGGGQTILDSYGLVSTTNFVNGIVNRNGPDSYSTSNVYTNMTGTSITTASLTRNTNILIGYTVNIIEQYNASLLTFSGGITVNIDGTDQTNNIFECQLHDTIASNSGTAYGWGGQISSSGIVTLGSGTHTFKLRAQTFNTSQVLSAYTASLYYILLGK